MDSDPNTNVGEVSGTANPRRAAGGQCSNPIENQRRVSDPHTPTWLILVLLWAFPPAAWYLLWTEHRYHWFPKLLELFVVIDVSLFVALSFTQAFSIFNIKYFLAVLLLVVIMFTHLWISTKFVRQLRSSMAPSQFELYVMIVLLLIDYLIIAFVPQIIAGTIISSIYNHVAQLQ